MPLDNPNDETDGDDFSSDCHSDCIFSGDSDGELYTDTEVENDDDGNNLITDHPATSIPSSSNHTPADSRKTYVSLSTSKRHLPICSEYRSLGGPTSKCSHCNALMWDKERVNKGNRNSSPQFSLCCGKGEIKLPKVKPTPQFLLDLHKDKEKATNFRRCIRSYNAMVNFSSIGGKVDHSINKGRGPKIFRMT